MNDLQMRKKYFENRFNEAKKSSISVLLPSGVSIQKKITANLKSWAKQFKERLDRGENQKDLEREFEEQIRDQIKRLADRVMIVYED
jgi:hypothetical protein